VGLAQYEVRGWVGWHHHMTLALLALWFVTLQRRRMGKKTTMANLPEVGGKMKEGRLRGGPSHATHP
jgi:SRSO17 transposase